MAYEYGDFGGDGCTCIKEVCHCHNCGCRISEDDGMYCEDCDREIQEETDIETNYLLDTLEGFVTNL